VPITLSGLESQSLLLASAVIITQIQTDALVWPERQQLVAWERWRPNRQLKGRICAGGNVTIALESIKKIEEVGKKNDLRRRLMRL
jgi:hypothetical protein